MTARPRIGFIGVGLMGHGIAKNIVEKGYPLTVLGHRNRKPVEDLVGRGAVEAESPPTSPSDPTSSSSASPARPRSRRSSSPAACSRASGAARSWPTVRPPSRPRR